MTSPNRSSLDTRGLVDEILDDAVRRRASDVHFEPTAVALEVRYRIDGMLETTRTVDAATGRSLITRLMVLAHLLTWRLDVPQEGRASVALPSAPHPLELRLSIMPTTHGLRAAVRLPAELIQPRTLGELGLSDLVFQGLERFAGADSGMLLVTGPAGSGKTTTLYALLAHIAWMNPGLNIVSLEDPVERDLPGVTQIEVAPFGELTYERTLRSILRQDPQVLMLGEIRDAATATLAVQAALSGHRLVSTLHAATPAGAISRLLEMGIEPYQVSSALFGVVSQRLLRRLYREGEARREGEAPAEPFVGGASARQEPRPPFEPRIPFEPRPPESFRPSGRRYSGRFPLAECVVVDDPLRRAILTRADSADLERIYRGQTSFRPMRDLAGDCIRNGITDESETRRVLGTV